MVASRYWRINRIFNLGSSNNNISELNFINEEQIPCNNPAKAISGTVDAANPAGNAFDGNTSTYVHSTNTYNNWWIGYVFDSPVTVTRISFSHAPGHGNSEEWQSVSVESSSDGVVWNLIGGFNPQVPGGSSATYSFSLKEIRNPAKVRDGVFWWNIIPNASCVFAIDYDIVIDNDSGAVGLSNNSDNFLFVENYEINKVQKSNIVGYTENNFIPYYNDKLWVYKCLNLYKKNLIFRTPINIPEQFTMILKTKVISKSVFLNTTSSDTSGHGLVFEGPDVSNSSDFRYNWRLPGYNSGLNYSESFRKGGLGAIETVILKGNLLTQDVTLITDYGVYTVPKSASAFTNFFNKQLNILGYTRASDFSPDANIVAYGLFNKEFNSDELSIVLNKIDENFLIKKLDINLSEFKTYEYSNINIKSNRINIGEKSTMFYKTINKINLTLENDIYISNLKIKNVSNIKDYVYKENVGVRTNLFLYERESGELIYKTESDDTGYFEFNNLDKNLEYVVTSNDKKHQFKSIIKNYDR